MNPSRRKLYSLLRRADPEKATTKVQKLLEKSQKPIIVLDFLSATIPVQIHRPT